MIMDITPQLMKRLAAMSPEQMSEWLKKCRAEELLMLDGSFEAFAADGQLPPGGPTWRTWLMMAGRGYGKTRAGAEWIHRIALGPPVRIALVGATIEEARNIMVEGLSGLLSIARRTRTKLTWEPSKGQLTWPRGTKAQLFSGDHGEGLRGAEHHFAWCDELSKWRQPQNSWDNLQFGLRAGERPRALVTTTPKPMPLLTNLRAASKTVVTGGRTADNLSLPAAYIEAMIETYGKTRLGRQELDGELIEDVEGSLWPRRMIERCRSAVPQGIDRIVIGVDPPAGVGPDCDACGIVVAARRGDAFYVLADESVQGLSPDGWARAVARAADEWSADRIVAEANNGGEMVRACLIAAGASIRPKLVHASRGKVARAEPIALYFEAGKAWFAGTFPALEDELSGLSIGGRYEGPGKSPDRADAMVWAMTELAEGKTSVPGVRAL